MLTLRQTAAMAALVLSAAPALASITLYSNRAVFDGAAPGLPIDRFTPTAPYPPPIENYHFHTRPVSSSTNDPIFPAGNILPGVIITTASPVFESQAIKMEPVAGGNQVGAATFEDTLILDFSPPISAAGFDVSGHVYAFQNFNGSVELTAYSGSTELLFTELPVQGQTFVGLTSTAADITRITLLFVYDEDACTFIANLAFGVPTCDGDLNGDGTVDLADLSRLLSHFGITSGAGANDGDLDGDHDVDLADLTTLLSRFGQSC